MCKYYLTHLFLQLLIINLYFCLIQAYRMFNENGVDIILAIENEEVNIECRTDMPIAYCGFLHSDTRYSFAGLATSAGKCSIKTKVTMNQTGEWRCHIGNQAVGEESMKIIELRVVKELAAVEKNIKTMHDKPRTLYCTTTRGFIPLSYCRFEPPNNLPFGIDSSITEKNPLLMRYYFPPNKSLDRGDCAVTISKVKYEDAGIWTCGAGLDDGTEHIDVINFEVEGLDTLSAASVTRITIGAIVIIAILCAIGYMACIKRRILGISDAPLETHELEEVRRQSQEQTSRPSSRQETPEPKSIPAVVVHSPSEPSTSSPLMPMIDK